MGKLRLINLVLLVGTSRSNGAVSCSQHTGGAHGPPWGSSKEVISVL